MLISKRAILSFGAFAALSGSMIYANDDLSLHDYTNLVSLSDCMSIATWDNDTDGFSTLDPRVRLKKREGVAGWSHALYEGKGCMSVKYPKGEPAERWRSIIRRFTPGLNLEGRTLLQYGVLASEGPGRDFLTRITLTGPKGQKFEAQAHIIPTLWRGVIFDISQCEFTNDIRAIEIAVRNEGKDPWNDAEFFVDGLQAGRPLDFDFNLKGSSNPFKINGRGKKSDNNGVLTFEFSKGATIEIRQDTSHNDMYNPPLEIRNTVRIVLENNSTADSLRLYFATDKTDGFNRSQSKATALPSKGQKAVIQFNLSDIAGAEGKLHGLKLEPTSGSGILAIDRITFEREAPILPNAGRITEAKANHKTLSVSGTTERQWLDSGAVSIELRHAPLYKSEFPADSLELLGYCPYSPEFTINTDNTRLDGKMTHLSSRLAVFAHLTDGRLIPVGQPFFIENWRDFTTNRYHFDLPEETYNVKDFGATGNGFTNDNHSIQKAIDTASEAGGGRVLIPADGEYIVTDLNMRSNVELYIEPGAVLRQSSLRSDYTSYRPEYGHDNIIPGVPWTHCMYTNMPLILAKDIENIKITGGGTIRMEDTYTVNDAWEHYARLCSDRIHVVPIAVCNTHNVEISDIDILRSNNYHTIFYRADSVFIGNLKMLEVACLSGDGISLGNAVTNVQIDRCVFESNDDGIVIAASYKDPRGGGWRIRVDSIDATIRNIDVMRSYIDSNRGGGGKAIAFIPWASTNPRLDHNEIDGINVHDCVLRGGHSVGTWPDNPFDGKPFTNDEQDDYSPIKNVDITGNEYLSLCDMLWVVPTSFVTDCGLHGSSEIKNGDFSDRTAYWTPCGNVDSNTAGEIKMQQGDTISQGLWLTPGTYEVKYTASRPMTVLPGETFTVDNDENFTITLKANSATTLSDVNLIKH